MPSHLPPSNGVVAPRTDRGEDERFMQIALGLGRRGLGNVWPNPAVGAVIVGHGAQLRVILARGWTQPGGRPHAETEALRRAGAAARGATLYVTLEPCSHHGRSPPCVEAIIGGGLERVVSAIEDPDPRVSGRGHAALRAQSITVDVGTGAEQARRDHAGHIRRVRDGRPHVILKLAVSADGKAGLSGRRPVAITGDVARQRVHMMRAMNDAVLVGIGTAVADDPLLNCRLPGLETRSPVRIVLDSQLRLSPHGRLARTAREIPLWVVASPSAPADAEDILREGGVEVMRVESNAAALDLRAVLQQLATRGITRLLVEAGPTIAAGFLNADLADAVVVFRSRKVIGSAGIDALEGMPLTAVSHSPRFRSVGVESVGEDTVETYEPV